MFAPPKQNWYERGMSNPLTHAGMGLLATTQPRYSTNIADLNGGGIGAGLLAGVGSYNAYTDSMSRRDTREGLLRTKQQEYEIKQQEAQRKAQAAQQKQQAIQGFLSNPNLNQQQRALLQGHIDPSAYNAAFPKPEKGPSSYEEYLRAYPDKSISYDQFLTLDANRKRPTTSVTNVMPGDGPGGLMERPLAPNEVGLLPPGSDPERFKVDLKTGKVVPRQIAQTAGEDPVEKEKRLAEQKYGNVEDTLSTYERLIKQHGTEYMPGPAKREIETARAQLILELKELYELGALQAPDMVIIEQILADPTTIAANVGGLLTGGGNVNNYISQISIIREKIDSSKKRAGIEPNKPKGKLTPVTP